MSVRVEKNFDSQRMELNQQTLKLLGDKLYEKRKQAALEIDRIVRELIKEKDHSRIASLLQVIIQDYSISTNSNYRNGGLIALAAIAIALGGSISIHLKEIVPPIHASFQDHDSRVRYYACESMYNVAKVARSLILDYFNEIFDALTKLSVDSESSVKNGAELLDRLVKDIVTEKSMYFHPSSKQEVSETESGFPPVPGTKPLQGITKSMFNVPRFIPLLTERIHVISAPGRLFLVQWIFVLHSVPDLELIGFLPEFIDGLFVYVSDPNVDVRTATLNVLGEFLKEMTLIQTEKTTTAKDKDSTIDLDFGKMTISLIKYLSSGDEETRSTALRWVIAFISLSKKTMLPFTPMLLGAILPTLSHSVSTIRTLAIDANTNLFTLVLEWSTRDQTGDPFDIVNTVVTLMQLCQDEHEDTRVGALEWLLMLHKKYPKQVMNSDQTLFQGLLKTLSDYSEEVVRRDLQLLAQISHSSDDEYFTKFMINLLNLFMIDRRLLETRGSLIIRQLCVSLNPERMYRSFGEILETEQDLEFASTMVQTLNLILITAPELSEMRKRLKNLENREGVGLFSALYKSWCHNPIAVFSLCLLAQAYEHASNLMTCFGELEISVQFLMQTDKLVQLLESPVFTSLRLQLLEPEKYPYLYKCLYGVLMVLPQSSAFATLRNRLNSVSTLAILQPPALHSPTTQQPTTPKMSKREKIESSVLKWGDMLNQFKLVQARHERARKQTSQVKEPVEVLEPRQRSSSLGSVSQSLGRYKKSTSDTRLKK